MKQGSDMLLFAHKSHVTCRKPVSKRSPPLALCSFYPLLVSLATPHGHPPAHSASRLLPLQPSAPEGISSPGWRLGACPSRSDTSGSRKASPLSRDLLPRPRLLLKRPHSSRFLMEALSLYMSFQGHQVHTHDGRYLPHANSSQISFQKTYDLRSTYIHLIGSRTFLLSGVLWPLKLSTSKTKFTSTLSPPHPALRLGLATLVNGTSKFPTTPARNLDFSPKHSPYHR